MQFSIKPVNLHHYDIYTYHPVQAKLLGKARGETLVGSICICLDGNSMDLYCKDNRMKAYSDVLSRQAYSYYENGIKNL